MFPCRGKNATKQANELVDYLNQIKILKDQNSYYAHQVGMIWLDI
jgi:hypothetical protein